jgi:hypothetical protein
LQARRGFSRARTGEGEFFTEACAAVQRIPKYKGMLERLDE